MHVPSYWEKKSIFYHRNIIVVGAGIVGISAALEAKRLFPKMHILIIDKLPYGAAASWRNAGFACFGSISEIVSDIKKYGEDVVVDLIRMRWQGLEDTIRLFGASKINFHRKGGFEIFEAKDDYDRYSEELAYVNRIITEAISKPVFVSRPVTSQLSFYKSMIANDEEGMLDTGRLMSSYYHLATTKGIEFIHGIELEEIREEDNLVRLVCEKRNVELSCDHLMLCTNAMTNKLVSEIDVIPARNQVLLTKKLISSPVDACYHFDEGYIYFRSIDDRILIGGARNKFVAEATDQFGANQENLKYLLDFLNHRILPIKESDIEFSWSGILTGGPSKIPIVQQISERVVAGVRLGGMGVAIGPQIGKKLATLLFS